ncbi:unnamed protein product [Camellia sinensis]
MRRRTMNLFTKCKSCCFFNLNYFEELILNGNRKIPFWFHQVGDNEYSRKIFFELRTQKYLEALGVIMFAAIAIFVNELKLFSAFNEDVFNDLTKLLTLDDFKKINYSLVILMQQCKIEYGGWDSSPFQPIVPDQSP